MKIQECNVLKILNENKDINQREIAAKCDCSVGAVNKSIKSLEQAGYIKNDYTVTSKARELFLSNHPKRAIILAAGFGMRMVPINTQTPKALLMVEGEALVERCIKQLHEAGVYEIYIVVGFMKEQFEYLIDDYGVKLIVNTEYASKNNLHSLKLATKYLENTYIIPCDIWCENNPYSEIELYSWYMVSDAEDIKSGVRVNRKHELVTVNHARVSQDVNDTEAIPVSQNVNDTQATAASQKKADTKSPDAKMYNCTSNKMIGIAYITAADAPMLKKQIEEMSAQRRYDTAFWEEALMQGDKMMVKAKIVPDESVVEINTYEQLRELDGQSNHLKSDAITTICEALDCTENEIVDIRAMKKGMTNRSFLFRVENTYIMRIPGEGTDKLINRREEAKVYEIIKDKKLCDDIEYINPENGYKITRFLENARVCDAENEEDLKKCMKKLREFHELGLKVDHEFDIFGQIEFYESLWDGKPSIYRDYAATKENVLSLKGYIERHVETKVLTHIDAVPDNFLFVDSKSEEDIRLIDWEYAGMQDPHVDIAMFCIYALYDREKIDRLIDIYFEGSCPKETRIKIYCYIAACGLLWSNWCEYKRNLGVEFGEYSLCQYRYAKEYYKIYKEELDTCK